MGAGECRQRSELSTAAAQRPSRPDSLNIRTSGQQGTINSTGCLPIYLRFKSISGLNVVRYISGIEIKKVRYIQGGRFVMI